MWRWNPQNPPEDGLPPEEVRITQLGAEPWPDGRRVRVSLEITPFLERPNIEVTITGAQDQEISSINIIGSIDNRMTFTMHLRGEEITGACTVNAVLTYPEIGTVHQERASFEVVQQPPEP